MATISDEEQVTIGGILILIVCSCLVIYWTFFQKRNKRIDKKHDRVPSGREDEAYRPRPVPTGSYCSLDEGAFYAFTNSGTLLYTNKGYIYWSEPRKHAEEVFIEMTKDDVMYIHTIWIKNSPCSKCADKLIQHFAHESNKPTVYIGKIWSGEYGDEESNKEGLRKMKRNGFKLLVWKDHRNKEEDETREYLKNIDNYLCIII